MGGQGPSVHWQGRHWISADKQYDNVYFPAWHILTSECEKEEADWCGCYLRHPSWMSPHSGANFPKTSPGSLFGALSPALDLGGSRKWGLGMICRHSGRWLMRPQCFAPLCQSEHWAPVAAHVTLYLPQSRVTDADPAYVSCSCVITIIASHWVSGEMVS